MNSEISSDVQYVLNHLTFGENNEDLLEITYGNETVTRQCCLTKEQTQQQPTINVTQHISNNTYRTLIMIDPDAPSSSYPNTGPFIHWIQSNFQTNHGLDGASICPYMGPGPRPGTGKHRYIFLLYQSPNQVHENKRFDDISERRKFPLADFVFRNQLELLHVTHFTIDA